MNPRERRTGWLPQWSLPLIWIALTPIATLTLTLIITDWIVHTNACVGYGFIGGDYWCQPGPVLIALVPGVLNLVPIIWLRSHNSKTRLAAAVATALGVLRLVVPAVAVFAGAAHTALAEGLRVDITVSPLNPAFPNDASFAPMLLSLALWLGTFVAIAIIARHHVEDR